MLSACSSFCLRLLYFNACIDYMRITEKQSIILQNCSHLQRAHLFPLLQKFHLQYLFYQQVKRDFENEGCLLKTWHSLLNTLKSVSDRNVS